MSYEFNASSEKLVGAFSTARDLPISMVAWVKKSNTSWGSTQDGIMNLGETTLDSTDAAYLINPDPTHRIQGIARDSADATSIAQVDLGATAYDDEWVMLYAIFTSTTSRRVGAETWAQSDLDTDSRTLGTTLDQIMLGNFNTGGANYLDGLLAECCMWSTALVEADIDALQTASETGPAPNTIQSGSVIGYWPLNTDRDTPGTILNEGSDGDGVLTITGATYNADHPTITGGGTNTIIIVPTGPPLS